MCGRFVASRPVEDIVEAFEVTEVEIPDELVAPRWNVAPQAEILAVRLRAPADEPAHRELSGYRWGLVPSWAKDPSFGNRAFNARAESIEEKPAFRSALAKRRCLIPADAFYEWKREGGRRRQPWVFKASDGDFLAFAGLWEAWKPRDDPSAEWLLTCTIVTTDANETVAPVHSRMPVVLERSDWERWLAPGPLDADDVAGMLRPAREGLLVAYPVAPAVNDARVDGPQLVEPLPPEGSGVVEEGRLFG